MTFFVDLNWQDYEIEKEEPVLGENGEPKLDESGKPKTRKVSTGIKMKIKPLTYEANQAMLSFAQSSKAGSKGTDEERAMSTMNSPDLPDFIRKIVPPHVKDLVGIELVPEDETERRVATIEDVVKYGAFMTIALSIFTKLSLISNLSEDEKDAIKKSLPGSSEVS